MSKPQSKPAMEILRIVDDGPGMQYEIPGTIPYWLAANPAKRRQLVMKLHDLATACRKKQWPFEEK